MLVELRSTGAHAGAPAAGNMPKPKPRIVDVHRAVKECMEEIGKALKAAPLLCSSLSDCLSMTFPSNGKCCPIPVFSFAARDLLRPCGLSSQHIYLERLEIVRLSDCQHVTTNLLLRLLTIFAGSSLHVLWQLLITSDMDPM